MKTTIACGQFAPLAGNIAANVDLMKAQARRASAQAAALIVFPELCLCGYPTPEQARAWAVTAAAEEMAAMGEIARTAGLALCFGFAERAEDGSLRNSMAFLDATGTLRSLYRKVHLWATERSWALPGEGFVSFDAGALRAGMWICYDTRFPEGARSVALAGATLGLVGTAWFGPAEEWELVVRARAIDNGMFVAASAAQGAFGETPFHGASLIVDPHGRVAARAGGGDDVICAAYDDEAVSSCRARIPLLSDLRPGAYA